jgi:hypothetical protein
MLINFFNIDLFAMACYLTHDTGLLIINITQNCVIKESQLNVFWPKNSLQIFIDIL